MSRLIPNMRRYFTDPFGRKDHRYYEGLSLEDKRKEYKCGDRFVTLDQIMPWSEWRLTQRYRCNDRFSLESLPEVNPMLNQKVSVWQGDITRLEIDAIVNAANRSLLGGGGVDGAIHSAAGWSLRDECEELNGCETGNSKLTSGHRLPAKYILHTVGPINSNRDALKSCYETCLQLVEQKNIRSVAFSCVATGVYGFPNEEAAHVALETCRSWLETEDHHKKIERIIFCVFLDIDYKIYQHVMQLYFPRDSDIPSEDSLRKRLDSLKQIPSEDNNNTNEIDSPNNQSQSNSSTPPPDSQIYDETHILVDQNSPQMIDDSLRQIPFKDNNNTDEIDSPNNQSQSNGSTPPDTQKIDEGHNSSLLNEDPSYPIDKSSSPQDDLNDKTLLPKGDDRLLVEEQDMQEDDRTLTEEQDMQEDDRSLNEEQDMQNSRQESQQQPLAKDSCSNDQSSDTTQHQSDDNIQKTPTLQKSVTAPPMLYLQS
ncbi:ADP-ribose glycohydrolase MACROD2-like isoform X2 [Dysidea avara]|uniref:ADP-ribose glycohydrolase MACROD2-like isoform X2 n=1 Tax=Dysidea avara TaxID=196820 RepID=UPI00331738D1